MDLTGYLFWITACITGGSALAVVLSQNIVRSAVWLLFCLAGVGGIFFLLGSDFVGTTQIIIYVGGIMVLVVFGVMLTAQGPFINMKVGAAEWAIALLVGAGLYAVLVYALVFSMPPGSTLESSFADSGVKAEEHLGSGNPATSPSAARLGAAFMGVRDAMPQANITGVPKGLIDNARQKAPPMPRTQVSYFLPFEIVSVHLLVVLIGAAYLARAKRRRGALA